MLKRECLEGKLKMESRQEDGKTSYLGEGRVPVKLKL
jgi:hypothetical protein